MRHTSLRNIKIPDCWMRVLATKKKYCTTCEVGVSCWDSRVTGRKAEQFFGYLIGNLSWHTLTCQNVGPSNILSCNKLEIWSVLAFATYKFLANCNFAFQQHWHVALHKRTQVPKQRISEGTHTVTQCHITRIQLRVYAVERHYDLNQSGVNLWLDLIANRFSSTKNSRKTLLSCNGPHILHLVSIEQSLSKLFEVDKRKGVAELPVVAADVSVSVHNAWWYVD